jgi:hypothetical protein
MELWLKQILLICYDFEKAKKTPGRLGNLGSYVANCLIIAWKFDFQPESLAATEEFRRWIMSKNAVGLEVQSVIFSVQRLKKVPQNRVPSPFV